MKHVFALIAIFLMLQQGKVFTQEKSRGIIPDCINLQFAGNIGSLSLGLGYYLNPGKNLQLDAVYGYSPPYRTGKAIHNLVARLKYNPRGIKMSENLWLNPYTAFAISRQIADEDRTFERLPKNFPEGYYAPNAFRLHLDLGASLHKKLKPDNVIRGIEYDIATTTSELYVQYFFNSRKVHPGDIFSLTMGINLILFE